MPDRTPAAGEPEEVQPTRDDVVAADMMGLLDITDKDPAAIAMDLFRRVLDAPTMAAAFDVLEGKTSDDYVGRTFTFTYVDVEWYYPKDRPRIPAAKTKAVDSSTGEVIDFWSSSGMLVAFLVKARLSQSFPVTWKIVEVTTGNGQKALNFAQV